MMTVNNSFKPKPFRGPAQFRRAALKEIRDDERRRIGGHGEAQALATEHDRRVAEKAAASPSRACAGRAEETSSF